MARYVRFTPGAASDLRHAAALINRSMTWSSTPQGGSYWVEVHNNLRNLADLADTADSDGLAKISEPDKPKTPSTEPYKQEFLTKAPEEDPNEVVSDLAYELAERLGSDSTS